MAESAEVIETRLFEARNAYHSLMTGTFPVATTMAGGDSLTYWTPRDSAGLKAYISELEAELAKARGGRHRRGPIQAVFY